MWLHVLCVLLSGGGGPEASEKSHWTAAPSGRDSAQAVNHGHSHQETASLLYFDIGNFLLGIKKIFVVFLQSVMIPVHVFEKQTNKTFEIKAFNPTLRCSLVCQSSLCYLGAYRQSDRHLKKLHEITVLPQAELTIVTSKLVTRVSLLLYYTVKTAKRQDWWMLVAFSSWVKDHVTQLDVFRWPRHSYKK